MRSQVYTVLLAQLALASPVRRQLLSTITSVVTIQTSPNEPPTPTIAPGTSATATDDVSTATASGSTTDNPIYVYSCQDPYSLTYVEQVTPFEGSVAELNSVVADWTDATCISSPSARI
jgi:hypothetical protein